MEPREMTSLGVKVFRYRDAAHYAFSPGK